MSFEISNSLQCASFESERLTLPQDTKAGNNRLYSSSKDVINMEEIVFDGKAEFALFSTKAYNVEATIGIAWNN